MSDFRLRSRSALLSLAVALAANSAGATTYYVAPSGSQGSAGTSKGSPTSVGSALGKVAAGDVVVFLDGTYTSTVYLSKSGSNGAPITLRADEGAVPVIRGPGSGNASGLTATANVSNYVIEGLWLENWAGGIELDWDNTVSNITIRHCVADSNLRNGISPYRATNVTIEYSIASRNGWGPSSWSSNFNIWAVKGTSNLVRGNVAFHGVDTSSSHSDGNGYILDVTLDQGTALFENNLGFLNGGSCISLTDSGSAKLVGNTCYGNSQEAASYMDEFNLGNTCRGQVDGGINVGQLPYTFTNLELRNNVAIPIKDGKDGVNVYNTSPCGGGTSYVNQGNYIQKVDATAIFAAPASADFRPKAGSAIVDKVAHGSTFATDIGFDPKCIKTETDAAKKKFSWWTFAPDLAYMKSKGGISGCFSPASRPQGSNQEIGAYELTGCSTAADCDDTNPCTTDSCNGSNQCAHAAVSGCCQTDTECQDSDPCTNDTCNLATHLCTSGPVSGCCNGDDQCGESSTCVEVSCNLSEHTCESKPVPACCTLATDCDDDDPCTTDTCAPGSGLCKNAAIQGCCELNGDCADDDACTIDTCTAEHTCSNVAPEGCCTSNADCVDADPCTLDSCNLTSNLCDHSPDPSCGAGGAGGSGTGGGGGTVGAGGSVAGAGGSAPSGGSPASGGSASLGGASGASAGTTSLGGAVGGGAAGSTGGGSVGGSPDPGCGCSVPARRPGVAGVVALGLLLGLSRRRRKR